MNDELHDPAESPAENPGVTETTDTADASETDAAAVPREDVTDQGQEPVSADASGETRESGIELFDFRRPGGLAFDNADCWRTWMDAFQLDFREKWLQMTRFETEVNCASPISMSFDKVRKQIANPAVARNMTLGSHAIPVLMVFPRQMALGGVLQLLGESLTEWPEDRPLTSIEASLCEIMFQRIMESLADSWPEKDPLPCQAGAIDLAPHRCRNWDPTTVMSRAVLELSLGDVKAECQWIMPQAELEELLSEIRHVDSVNTADSRQKMQECLYRVPAEVNVALGEANVSVARLANLKKGDVVILDQKIHEPLPLVVEGKTKFHGWLGRSGSRQAFNIIQTG